jgi:hypothetical protein
MVKISRLRARNRGGKRGDAITYQRQAKIGGLQVARRKRR